MKKTFILAFLTVVSALCLQSCVDETGAGTPSPKSMFLEKSEYDVNVTTDSVSALTLRWIDVGNATYRVFLANSYTTDTTYIDASGAVSGDLETMSLTIPYTTLTDYVSKERLLEAAGSMSAVDFSIGVTGTPIDMTKPTALSPMGSSVTATLHYNK